MSRIAESQQRVPAILESAKCLNPMLSAVVKHCSGNFSRGFKRATGAGSPYASFGPEEVLTFCCQVAIEFLLQSL